MTVSESYTGWEADVTELRNNLRLPIGFDEDLLAEKLRSAYDYVEKHTNQTLREKTVTCTFIEREKIYFLPYAVKSPFTSIVVKNNGTVMAADEYVYHDGNPGFIKLVTEIEEDDVITISFTSKTVTNDGLSTAILAIASEMYLNPNGLGASDMKRLQHFLTSIR